MSKSTFMPSAEWNVQDGFSLQLHSPGHPQRWGLDEFKQLFDFAESMEGLGQPAMLLRGERTPKYSREAVRKVYLEGSKKGHATFALRYSSASHVDLWIRLSERNERGRFFLNLDVTPLSFIQQAGKAEEQAKMIVSWVKSFASRFPMTYAFGHSSTDFLIGNNPLADSPFAPYQVYELYWLNVFGPQMVSEIGRERVLSTPAKWMEELPGGAVLLLTRPTPADFDSAAARQAQARALVHLRPELSLETTLDTLRERSRVFEPIPVLFDEDVADIFQKKLAFHGLANKRPLVERFNLYRPPPVSEWLPVAQAPVPDVQDVRQAIDTYEGLYAEQFIALMYSEHVPEAGGEAREALASVDFALWHRDWGTRFDADEKEALIPALGAWLGLHLVSLLGGQWVPRRNLEEAGVRLGDRFWLPFLRARHALQNADAPLDYSCSQFFRQARRSTQTAGNASS